MLNREHEWLENHMFYIRIQFEYLNRVKDGEIPSSFRLERIFSKQLKPLGSSPSDPKFYDKYLSQP